MLVEISDKLLKKVCEHYNENEDDEDLDKDQPKEMIEDVLENWIDWSEDIEKIGH